MRIVKKNFSFTLLLCIMIFMNGCVKDYKGYQGDFPELYTVAIYSLPGIRGYSGTSPEPMYYDPSLRPVDEDEYGRVLFAYNEQSGGDVYLLIMQKFDDEFVYFYQHINYVIKHNVDVVRDEQELYFDAAIATAFSDADKQELKELNDWGRDFDETKRVKVEITRKKS